MDVARTSVNLNAELPCPVHDQHIAPQVSCVGTLLVVQVHCQEQQPFSGPPFHDELFLLLDLHHTIGVSEHIGADEQLELLLMPAFPFEACATC